MIKNPLLILCLFLLFQRHGGNALPALSSLQLESLIDEVHTMIHAIEKLSAFNQSGLGAALPDMKKMLEAVEKIPL